MDRSKLDSFVERIMSIRAGVISIYSGTNVPGMGALASVGGAFNSGMEVTLKLDEKTILFAKAYKNGTETKETISSLAKDVEGELLNEQVLSVLKIEESKALIDQLHELVDDFKSN